MNKNYRIIWNYARLC
ncbi:hypothetical protein JK229_22280 [Pantoea dispersa]|nr:hypothetical protein [Pantoea dispersa]